MPSEGENSGDLALSDRAGARGFALVEALVAGALLGWILLVGLDFLVLEKRAEERLAAHRQAMRAVESTVELIRSGRLVPEDGPVDLGDLASTNGIQLHMEVATEGAMSDLLRVRVEAHYQVHGEPSSRDLETLVWRPY